MNISDIIKKIKSKPVIAIIVIVLVLGVISQLFGDSDDSGSSNKISLKNGVLVIVPELQINMTFDNIPERWLPSYTSGIAWNDEEYITLQKSWSNGFDIEYEGIKFYTYFTFDKDRFFEVDIDVTPLVKEISCEARNVTTEQAKNILKKLKKIYGEPIGEVYGSICWIDGGYTMDFSYEDGKLNIGIVNYETPFIVPYKK